MVMISLENDNIKYEVCINCNSYPTISEYLRKKH